MNSFKAWFSKNKTAAWLIAGMVIVMVIAVIANSAGGSVLSGLAGVLCDTSELQTTPNIGFIIAPSGVNVRTGPGENYDFVSQTQNAIPVCKKISLAGRNDDSTWLYVSSDNLTGWIKYDVQWESVNVNINSLPVSNIVGAPSLKSGSSGSGYGGPITDNYFAINGGYVSSGKITGLTANQPYKVALAPSDAPNKAVIIWQGTTEKGGTASFHAPFPAAWADGSKIKSGTLSLVIYVNGAAERSISLTYSTK